MQTAAFRNSHLILLKTAADSRFTVDYLPQKKRKLVSEYCFLLIQAFENKQHFRNAYFLKKIVSDIK